MCIGKYDQKGELVIQGREAKLFEEGRRSLTDSNNIMR